MIFGEEFSSFLQDEINITTIIIANMLKSFSVRLSGMKIFMIEKLKN